MLESILGVGLRFPLMPDAMGRLGYSQSEENVEQSLRILLQTIFGERIMRPTFGCGAAELVFAPGSQRYLGLLETSVRDAIRDWEPRIDLEEVHAEADPSEPERVDVSVVYRIRLTNTRTNLVFPLYPANAEIR